MTTFSIFGKDEMKGLIGKFEHREQLVRQELANATNKAAREVINLAREEWDAMLTARGYMDKRIKIVKGASPDNPEAIIKARSRHTRANRFHYFKGPGGKGVHLNVNRGSGGAMLNNAFVIPSAKSDGKPLILERKQKYEKGDSRFLRGKKFKAVYGPSVNQFFTDARHRVAPEAISSAKKQFLRAIT